MEPTSSVRKKRKIVNESQFLSHLPQLTRYIRSYMHRDTVIGVTVTPRTDFIITTSVDGFVKFWKKQSTGIEFVKQYRAHIASITSTAISADGSTFVTAGPDKSVKVFDVANFDLITMLQLDYTPKALCWIHNKDQLQALLAVSDLNSPTIYIYDIKGETTPVHTLKSIHTKPVILISYNEAYSCAVSCDESGTIEYWSPEYDYVKPPVVFEMKSSTDLYEFRKNNSVPTCITMSPNGENFASISFPDRQVRIFKFRTGKIIKKYDESLGTIEDMQQAGTSVYKLEDIEFGRRLATERELEKVPSAVSCTNVIFDETGLFIIYATLLGVKVVNTNSNVCAKLYAKDEKLRILNLSVYQGAPKKPKTTTLAMAASENPLLQESLLRDPTLFATGFKKGRFYLFSNNEVQGETKADRDVFNEKPTLEEQLSSATEKKPGMTGTSAILHTSIGDIHLRLYPEAAPKAVENFVTHSKNGYYDKTIFHRVIPKFMIQGGDPLGDGTGGESIWGVPFEDEFSSLKHDKPYMVSMANSGPSTNGSQFFITTDKTPWLDGKHTIFGKAISGFDLIHKTENAKTGRLDRPEENVTTQIVNITIK